MTLALSMRVFVHGYEYMCILSCARACIHHRSHHTTHLPDDSGVFLYTRQYMTCGEHHHFTEQLNLNGLLHLCQSLQDLLKYCWVQGARIRDWSLSNAQMHSNVCVCARVNGTQYYMCLVLVM